MKANLIIFGTLLLLVTGCQTELEYCWTCGENLIDERDGQTYRTREINGNCWMIENLRVGKCLDENINIQNEGNIEHYCPSPCFGENPCETGGLYTWNEATAYQKKGLQGICPSGWHLPSTEDFKILIEREIHYRGCSTDECFLVGGYVDELLDLFQFSPYAIWENSVGINYNMQELGIVPGRKTVFWSRTESERPNSMYCLQYCEEDPELDGTWARTIKIDDAGLFKKTNGFCVRCIKDN